MSDMNFADNPGQARIMAEREAAARQPTPEELQQQFDNFYDFRNSLLNPAPQVPVVPPVVTTTGGAGATGGSVVLPRTGGAAADELRAVLRRYGLDGLFNDLNAAVIADSTLVKNADALFGAVRQNPIYQQRFKGNAERVKKGLPELSEAEYVNQEQSYTTVLKNLGMPRGFYDSQDNFANFIANDISPVELGNRIQQGYNAVTQAPPEVLTQLKMMVPDLTDSDLAAYFLDPQKSGIEIEQRARAATIAAAAKTQSGMQLTASQATGLAKQGVTTQEAQQAFGQIGQQAQLFRPLQGEQAITQEDILAGTFSNEQAAAQRIAKRRRGRQATFEAGGSLAAAQQSNVGLSTVGQ